jgi:hypothetical protein
MRFDWQAVSNACRHYGLGLVLSEDGDLILVNLKDNLDHSYPKSFEEALSMSLEYHRLVAEQG